MCDFSLTSHQLTVELLSLVADILLKPLLQLLHNGLVKPVFVFVFHLFTAMAVGRQAAVRAFYGEGLGRVYPSGLRRACCVCVCVCVRVCVLMTVLS